jgi:hypothetical protein
VNRLIWAALPVAVLALAGCGGEVTPVTPVAGKVTFGANKPADNLLLQFLPTNAKGGKPLGGSAISDASGQFSVKADDGRDGLPVGSYTVVVIDNNLNTDDEPGTSPKAKKPPANRVPPKYMATDGKNPLTLTVEAGKSGYELKLD